MRLSPKGWQEHYFTVVYSDNQMVGVNTILQRRESERDCARRLSWRMTVAANVTLLRQLWDNPVQLSQMGNIRRHRNSNARTADGAMGAILRNAHARTVAMTSLSPIFHRNLLKPRFKSIYCTELKSISAHFFKHEVGIHLITIYYFHVVAVQYKLIIWFLSIVNEKLK